MQSLKYFQLRNNNKTVKLTKLFLAEQDLSTQSSKLLSTMHKHKMNIDRKNDPSLVSGQDRLEKVY